ncbi:hypothetical protein VNI00_011661 [Paramarasmius palmivorus]|uniref:Uncharacterized protein n=1 Tax=Paramarasmius palmivorus TaxID=297713 RepID=A0AAW0CCH9_9AGAR
MAYAEHSNTASAIRIAFRRRPSFSVGGVSRSKKDVHLPLPLNESQDDTIVSYSNAPSSGSNMVAIPQNDDSSDSAPSPIRNAAPTLIRKNSVSSTASGRSTQIITRGKRAFQRTANWVKDLSEYAALGSSTQSPAILCSHPSSPTDLVSQETEGRHRRNSSARKAFDFLVPPFWKKLPPVLSPTSDSVPLDVIPETPATNEVSRPSTSSITSDATVMMSRPRPSRLRCDSSASQLSMCSTVSTISETSSGSQPMSPIEFTRDEDIIPFNRTYDLEPPSPSTFSFHKGLRNRGSTIRLTPFTRGRSASDASDPYFASEYTPPFVSFCLKDDGCANAEEYDWNGEWSSNDIVEVQQKLRLLRSL